MGSGYSKMKKQRKAMESQMAEMQKQMDEKEIVGVSPGGLVKVTLSGTKGFKKISIRPECVDPEDVEGLEDLISAAFKAAEEAVDTLMQEGPFSMPGSF
jgi:DNA-binding YbaB/EbfC family protein